MRICFVLSASNTKGANGALLELIDALDKGEFSPYVILPSNGPIIHELEIRSIPFKVFYYKWWMHKEGSPRWKWLGRRVINCFNFPRICYQILKWHCDIVYTNTITINAGLFSAIILKKSHIFHIHEFGYRDHKLIFDFGKTISLLLANKFTKHFIFISHAVADEYSKFIERSKSKVVYQSVTVLKKMSDTLNFKKHKVQCVIVGRLAEGKRQEDAIRAINILVKESLDIGLWIVGEGDKGYKKYLKKITKKNNIEKHVAFCGWHDNPLPFIKKADIALMCSRCEGFGRVTIEAMLMGKPVIGAKSGGTAELIQESFNGLFYTPGDYRDLAKKISFFCKHPSLIHKMGENAKQWASKQFTQERYGTEICQILKSV